MRESVGLEIRDFRKKMTDFTISGDIRLRAVVRNIRAQGCRIRGARGAMPEWKNGVGLLSWWAV